MFLLDTNVLSALIGTIPPLPIARWMARQTYDVLFTASVCQAELLAGLAVMPAGRRRLRLEQEAETMFGDDFRDQILPFDTDTAVVYAHISPTVAGPVDLSQLQI